jgi:hypothetical protein
MRCPFHMRFRPLHHSTVAWPTRAIIDADGIEIKRSLYKPSVTRDVAMARKRIRDGVAKDGDERLATAKVVAVADSAGQKALLCCAELFLGEVPRGS